MEKQKLSLQPLRDRARLEDESAPARRRPIFDASSARKRGREAVAKSPLRDLETSLSLRPPSRSSLFDIITRIYSSHIRIAGIDSPPFLNLLSSTEQLADEPTLKDAPRSYRIRSKYPLSNVSLAVP